MKKRILSLLLSLLMVMSIAPVNVIAEGAEDYSANVTGTAVFNPAWNTVSGEEIVYGTAYVTDDPTLGLNMSTDYTMSLEGVMDQTFYINNYYSDGTGYWYELAALAGETLPDKLSDMPWVYQNDIPSGAYPDYLIVTPPVVKPTDPTDPSEPDNSCACCESCTGAEGCQCLCGECDFCQPEEEPERPTLTHPTGVEVTAESFPEGVSLTVQEVSVSSQLNKYQIPESKQVFGLDISLLNADSSIYQPGSALVKVPVSAPVGTKIGIIHDHNGNISFVGVTKVLSDGTVEFYTDSFSTFAGFTVDFHYNGVDFSIEGLSSILLSDLFIAMGIEEDAYAAKSVVFSDNTLVGVERQDDGNWLLTSLEAFTTNETLIVTFDDGHVIIIDVTDKQYPDRGKFTNHNSANDASFYHDGGATSQGYRSFGAVSGVSSTWSVWDGGNHVIYIYLYDTAGNPVDYSYFDEHPQTGGYLSFSGNYWYEMTRYDFSVGSPGRIDADTLSMGDLGWPNIWPGPTINWVEVRMHSLNVLDNKTYAKVTQVSKFARSGETGNRTVIVYANNVEVDRKTVLFPTFESMSASDISVSTYAGWIPRGNVSGAGATVVVADGVYKVYIVSQNTIKYDLDGGSGSFPNQTKTYGVQLNLHSGEPTKTGYSFNHWVSQFDGSTWAKGANFTPDRADTLKASYSPVPYTATFDANGGSVTPASSTFNIEGALSLPTPSAAPAGYTFAGWKVTSAQGNWVNGTAYSKTTTSIPKGQYGNVTLTAQWEPLSYTIHYLPNGGSGTAMTDQTVKYDSNVTIKANSYTAPKGHQFLSWSTKSDDTDDGYNWTGWSGKWVYTNGQYGISDQVLNLYARWGKKTFTVNYHSNGGSGSMDSHTVAYGSTVQIKGNDFTPPPGMQFAGWAVSVTGTAGEYGWSETDKTGWAGTWNYDNGEHGISNNTLNLYAIWENASYTVTWKNWDGSTLDTDTVINGGSATYDKDQPTRPDAAGYSYTFNGWDKGSNGTVSNVTANTTVTAQYAQTPISYTATFDYNGGDSDIVSRSFTVESTLSLPALTRTGYRGVWKVTTAAGNWSDGTEYAPGSSITEQYGNVAFTAQWEVQYRYVLKFDANGGSGGPADRTQDWCGDTSCTFSWDQNSVPTRDGYSFLGWAESSASQTNVAGSGYNSYRITGKQAETVEKTLFAIWKRDTGDLKLTFNGTETAPAIVTVTGQGKTITLVLTKSETVIKDLPTGTYKVTVESGNASYTASVKSNTDPRIEKDQTAVADIGISSKGLNWFTAFFRVKNECKNN